MLSILTVALTYLTNRSPKLLVFLSLGPNMAEEEEDQWSR